MRDQTRRVTWHGKTFRFDRLTARASEETLDWAVSCGLEFIGTMAARMDVTTGEFEVRCERWLDGLLGPAGSVGRKGG